MFGLFKSNPTKKLRKQHDLLLEKAVHAQRNGKMAEYAKLYTEADKLFKEIEKIEKDQTDKKNK
ncbi:MAG: hypothetical protein CME62_06140 [Halobacteriovoraceae bacterium]|nr:hypothetical protein [Halobacteriovoraceae bacterium]|tara:strand:+ start:20543 stop:20734 length:192 start_codon:yes stop_codon:yes gene_type:complete